MAYLNIAQVFREAKMYAFAASTCRKWISLYPRSPGAHTLLYVSLRESGSLEEARMAA